MYVVPINDLNKCSVRNCKAHSAVIVQKKIGGDGTIMFGYCAFHSIISNTFFSSSERKEIRI